MSPPGKMESSVFNPSRLYTEIKMGSSANEKRFILFLPSAKIILLDRDIVLLPEIITLVLMDRPLRIFLPSVFTFSAGAATILFCS